MSSTLVVLAVLGTGLAIIFFGVGTYNSLVQVRNNVDKAFNNIDVLLKQRHDELPKLIDTCRAYMEHERAVLEHLTRLREHYDASPSPDEKVAIENEINRTLSAISGRWESYPELKSSESFLQIQSRVSQLEASIADRREFFNDSVNIYNIQIERFPDALLAILLGYERRRFLEVAEHDKKDVAMAFA